MHLPILERLFHRSGGEDCDPAVLPENHVSLPAGFRPKLGIHDSRSAIVNYLELPNGSRSFNDGMATFNGYFDETYALSMVAVNRAGERSMGAQETAGYKFNIDLGIAFSERCPGGFGPAESIILIPKERTAAEILFRLAAHDAAGCQRNFQLADIIERYAKAVGMNYLRTQDELTEEGAKALDEIRSLKLEE